VNRRRFVFGGLAALGAVGVGAATLQLQPSADRAPREALRVLSARQFAAIAAIAETVMPAAAGLPSPWDLRVPEKVDALLDRMHPAAAAEVGLVLDLFESPLVGLVFGGRPRPFSQLDVAARERVLAAWRDSRFQTRRVAWKAVLGLVKGAYWSDPGVDAFVGYPRMRFGP
jgi:long-chain-alcohol oxidase